MSCGCKHGKVDRKSVLVFKTIIILVKRLKVVANCCLNVIFFMVSSGAREVVGHNCQDHGDS